PGYLTVNFAGQEVTLSPIAAIAALVIAFGALWLLFKLAGLVIALYRFICGDETAFSRYFDRSRERRGVDYLGKAMAALASGDGRTARIKAAKAEDLLNRPEITRLVTAKAAEMSGNEAEAKRYYKALAEDKRTSFAGVKGLLELARAEGDDTKALKLAEQAFQLNPKDEWVLETLYALQSRSFDWQGARKTLSRQRVAGFLPKPEANRRDAMLALAQAEDAEELGQTEHARQLSVEAAKLDPVNSEAVASAARHLAAAGSKRAATRLITKAWSFQPTPQLAASFAALEPEESPDVRLKRFKTLFDAKATGAEANLVRAELALSVEDWGEARRFISKVDEETPSARTCAIMATIARGEGEPEEVVRGWLAKALDAPRMPEQDGWLTQAAMLPLLVGESAKTETDDNKTSDAEPVTPTSEPEKAPA
ncbi:MAG: heme biosynthesis HemY N-terminal domain-containing protein, partial [Pseudomonadota bacterium]